MTGPGMQRGRKRGQQERGRRKRGKHDRERAERLGRWAEFLCRLALMLKGYRILATRLRTPAGEIDILAEQRTHFGPVLAVVEVKARAGEYAAHAAVGSGSWHRLARAAGMVQAARPRLSGHTARFDLMIVTPRRWPRHLPDYWRPQG